MEPTISETNGIVSGPLPMRQSHLADIEAAHEIPAAINLVCKLGRGRALVFRVGRTAACRRRRSRQGERLTRGLAPDSEKLQIDGKVDASGKLDATIAYEIRGDSELPLRQTFRSVGSAQWQHVVEDMSTREGLGKEVTEVKISDPAATRQPFTFSYRLTKANYLDPSKKKLDLRLPLAILGLATVDPDDADSADPIKLGPPNDRDYRIRLELPSKYSARAPLPIAQKRDYGSYEAIYKLDGNVFTAERKLAVSVAELPSARVQDYAAFRRVVTSDWPSNFRWRPRWQRQLLLRMPTRTFWSSAVMRREKMETMAWRSRP